MSAVYLWAAFEHPFLSPMNAGLGMSHINFNRNILGSIMDPASLTMGSKIRVNYLDFSFNSNVDISGGLFIQAAL